MRPWRASSVVITEGIGHRRNGSPESLFENLPRLPELVAQRGGREKVGLKVLVPMTPDLDPGGIEIGQRFEAHHRCSQHCNRRRATRLCAPEVRCRNEDRRLGVKLDARSNEAGSQLLQMSNTSIWTVSRSRCDGDVTDRDLLLPSEILQGRQVLTEQRGTHREGIVCSKSTSIGDVVIRQDGYVLLRHRHPPSCHSIPLFTQNIASTSAAYHDPGRKARRLIDLSCTDGTSPFATQTPKTDWRCKVTG